MTRDLWTSLFLIVIGSFFAIHCFRAGRKELRTGIAEGGRWGTYRRGEIGFWPIILLTFAASVMGIVLLSVGLALAASAVL